MTTTPQLPKKLADFLKQNPTVKAELEKRDDGVIQYRLICPKCKERLYIRSVTTEGSDFNWYNDDFTNWKFNMIECDWVLACGCRDAEYDAPEDYEVSW